MRALQLVAPGKLVITEVAVPEIGPDDVLLRVRGAGLCHSDLHVRHLGVAMLPMPLTLGHEVAGTVEALGARVQGWAAGDAALVHLIWACGSCPACVRGDDNVCEAAGRLAQPPTPGLGPAGGMADFMAVPARHLVPLGDLDPVACAPLADAAMTPYHAVRNSQRVLRPGSSTVVIGVGGLGHVAVQLLRELSATRIIAVDVSAQRLQISTEQGADLALVSGEGTAAAILEATSGRGADAIIDFVGSQQTVDLSAATIAPDGIYQLVGLAGGQVPLAAQPRTGEGWPYGAAVRTSYGGTKSDLVECVALARAGRISIEVEQFPLADGITAFDRLEAGTVNGRAVLIP